MGAISPGRSPSTTPTSTTAPTRQYLAALRRRPLLRVQGDHRRGLQPADRLARHGDGGALPLGRQQRRRLAPHLPLAVDALNAALDGIPPEQVRLHVCWGNYGGPHHMRRRRSREIIDRTCSRSTPATIYVEGANPRHAHEWRVFNEVALPDDKSVILGVIDVKSNCVEHPRLVADRLVQLGKIIGKERLLAGTDCGFDTFIRFSPGRPGRGVAQAQVAGRRR